MERSRAIRKIGGAVGDGEIAVGEAAKLLAYRIVARTVGDSAKLGSPGAEPAWAQAPAI
jgi:hypothetical protein